MPVDRSPLGAHAARVVGRARRLANRVFSSWVRVQMRACGQNFSITIDSTVEAPDRISVGDNFSAFGGLRLYANDGDLVIGDNVSVNHNVQVNAANGRIVIGNNVLIAANVVLRAADHRFAAARLIREQGHESGTILVEDDVWIGSNAVVTKDVTLARGTVVGAGAVVTRSTEAYSVVGGVPARLIGRRG